MRIFLAAMHKITNNEKPSQWLTREVLISAITSETKFMIQQPLKIKID